MMCRMLIVALGGLVMGSVVSVQGHHAVNAQYDMNKVQEMDGVLRKVEWINPHAFLTFDVKMPDGTIQSYRVEGPPPAGWRRAGVATKGTLVVGTTYKFEVWPQRDGSAQGLMTVLFLPDGRRVGLQAATNLPGERP